MSATLARVRALRFFAFALVVAGPEHNGCATQMPDIDDEPPERIGFEDASSADMRPDAELMDEDLFGVAKRGVELYWMERALNLAYERGLPRVGKSVHAAIMPIATADEGYHSAGVTFYRWFEEDLDEAGHPDPTRAKRWLAVPILLRPDRVLELEQFGNEVETDAEVYRRIVAIELAAKAALEQHPQGNWSFHTFREEKKVKNKGRVRQTRVYMLGRGSPDLEALVLDERGRKEPAVVTLLREQQPVVTTGSSIKTSLNRPGVSTVARALAVVEVAGTVPVESADGSRWSVAAETGEISRIQ